MRTVYEWEPSERYPDAQWMRMCRGDNKYTTLWLQQVSADVFQYKAINHVNVTTAPVTHKNLPWIPLNVTTRAEAEKLVKVLLRME